MRTYIIDDEKILLALKEIARNLVYFTDNPLPKYPQMQGGGFFAVSHGTSCKQAEVVIHGIDNKDLRTIVSFLNSHTFYNYTMFGSGVGYKVNVDALMPYIILCNDKQFKSSICNKSVTFF